MRGYNFSSFFHFWVHKIQTSAPQNRNIFDELKFNKRQSVISSLQRGTKVWGGWNRYFKPPNWPTQFLAIFSKILINSSDGPESSACVCVDQSLGSLSHPTKIPTLAPHPLKNLGGQNFACFLPLLNNTQTRFSWDRWKIDETIYFNIWESIYSPFQWRIDLRGN